MNIDTLYKHINLDDLIQDRLSCIPISCNIEGFTSAADLYHLYNEYIKNTDEFFTPNMFLKYFKNKSKFSSQIDGSYCLYRVTESKIYLMRFVPLNLHLSWSNNILAVNRAKFMKHKFEITDYFNHEKYGKKI
jgi:hypothetical protein